MAKKCIIFLFFFFLFEIVFAQSTVIKGRVLSEEDNLPIADVNIIIKGTHIGTTTDKNGNFRLSDVKLPTTLEFSHVSYTSYTKKLKSSNVVNNEIQLNVLLHAKVTTLREFNLNISPVRNMGRLVHDFEIVDGYVYVTCNRKDGNILQIYTDNETLVKTILAPEKYEYFGWDFMNEGYLCLMNKKRTDYYRLTAKDSLEYIPFDTLGKAISHILRNIDEFYQSDGAVDTFHSWCESQYRLFGNRLENGVYKAINPTHHLLTRGFTYKRLGANCFVLTYSDRTVLGDVFVLYVNQEDKLKIERIFYQELGFDWLKPKRDTIELKKVSENVLKQFDHVLAGLEGGRNAEKSFSVPNMGLSDRFTRDHLFLFCGSDSSIYIINKDNEIVFSSKVNPQTFDGKYFSDIQLVDTNYCWIRYNHRLNELCKVDLHTGDIIKRVKLLRPNAEKVRVLNNTIYFTCPVREKSFYGTDRQLFVQTM